MQYSVSMFFEAKNANIDGISIFVRCKNPFREKSYQILTEKKKIRSIHYIRCSRAPGAISISSHIKLLMNKNL